MDGPGLHQLQEAPLELSSTRRWLGRALLPLAFFLSALAGLFLFGGSAAADGLVNPGPVTSRATDTAASTAGSATSAAGNPVSAAGSTAKGGAASAVSPITDPRSATSSAGSTVVNTAASTGSTVAAAPVAPAGAVPAQPGPAVSAATGAVGSAVTGAPGTVAPTIKRTAGRTVSTVQTTAGTARTVAGNIISTAAAKTGARPTSAHPSGASNAPRSTNPPPAGRPSSLPAAQGRPATVARSTGWGEALGGRTGVTQAPAPLTQSRRGFPKVGRAVAARSTTTLGRHARTHRVTRVALTGQPRHGRFAAVAKTGLHSVQLRGFARTARPTTLWATEPAARSKGPQSGTDRPASALPAPAAPSPLAPKDPAASGSGLSSITPPGGSGSASAVLSLLAALLLLVAEALRRWLVSIPSGIVLSNAVPPG